MPLDETKAASIIEVFKGLDVTQKLHALNEARELFPTFFTEGMSNLEYAKAAMRIEQLYNLIREELRVPQHRIKQVTGEGSSSKTSKPKIEKKDKKAQNTMDMNEMLKAFAQFNKEDSK